MKVVRALGVALCGALLFTSVAAAQRSARRMPGTPAGDEVGVVIALQAGGDSYQFNGQGTCTQEPKGYIYGVPAHLRTIEQSDGQRSIRLTFWSPANKSTMFSLYMSNRGKSYETDTVTGKDAGPTSGSGTVTFAAAGAGGTFTVNATTAKGAKVTGTIRCDTFRTAIAEGGN